MEKIDELRQLLDLHNRDIASVVVLNGITETTYIGDMIRSYARNGDVAFVVVGPEDKVKGILRENKKDGTRTFEVTFHRDESFLWEWPNSGPMLDLTCSKCNESGKGTYEIPVGCMNCDLQVVGIFSRGHEAYHSQECPDCGCRTLSSSYARKPDPPSVAILNA